MSYQSFATFWPLVSMTQPSSPLSHCPLPPSLSCPAHPSIPSCCSPTSGLFVQTQFWDPLPQPTGPEDSWTIHGLWPDNCDGTWEDYCDDSRAYSNISDIIRAADDNAQDDKDLHRRERRRENVNGGDGEASLLDKMTKLWKAGYGTDEHLWEHEWNKHGTCISTLVPSCYGDDYKAQEEVVSYFRTTVKLFGQLPTYTWLEEAGITPLDTETYDLTDVLEALYIARGVKPVVRCENGVLKEVWYYFLVKGTVQDGAFVPTEPVDASSSCPTKIRYLPKSAPPSSISTSSSPTWTSVPHANRGTLQAFYAD